MDVPVTTPESRAAEDAALREFYDLTHYDGHPEDFMALTEGDDEDE